MRIAAFVLVAALALAAGCKTSQSDVPPPTASTYEGEGNPKLKFKDEGGGGGSQGSGGPNALNWVAVPFENIVYLPWKVVGGLFKGASDGVSAGFAKDRMPIMGVIFSPVNLIIGGVTGAVEGAVGSPGVIGPSDSFGHAMSQPTKHATSIWWYE